MIDEKDLARITKNVREANAGCVPVGKSGGGYGVSVTYVYAHDAGLLLAERAELLKGYDILKEADQPPFSSYPEAAAFVVGERSGLRSRVSELLAKVDE